MTTMKVYLSGPMSGFKNFNVDAFVEAKKRLEHYGYEVLCPMAENLRNGFDPTKGSPWDVRQAWRRNINSIFQAEAVVVLDHWQRSHGCNIEVSLATTLGLDVYRYVDICLHFDDGRRSRLTPLPFKPASSANGLLIEASWRLRLDGKNMFAKIEYDED